MDLQGKKILVTGADGFIGSHLTEALVQRGCDVHAFVPYNSFGTWGWLEHSPHKHDIAVFAGDIRNADAIKAAMQGCAIVLHLAALVAIPYSYFSPSSYVDTNITGTLNVLQAARELGVEKIIHTSTSEVYGSARFVPITEDHPLQAQSPYAATKIAADQLALSFFHAFATPVIVVRPFNAYGPRQSARAVIPTIITQLLNGQTDIHLGALHPTRDFNFVSDTVRGFIAAASATQDAVLGEVINIGSAFEISVGDTARLIAELIGKPINLICQAERTRPVGSEVNRLYSSNAKAYELLGWSPQYGGIAGFTRGLSETIDWFAQQSNLQQYKATIYNT